MKQQYLDGIVIHQQIEVHSAPLQLVMSHPLSRTSHIMVTLRRTLISSTSCNGLMSSHLLVNKRFHQDIAAS